MSKLLHVGLDVGSTTVKIVVLDENLNTLYTKVPVVTMMGCRDWDGNYFKYNDDTKYRQLLNYYSQASYNNVIDEANRIHSLFYLPEKKENESS